MLFSLASLLTIGAAAAQVVDSVVTDVSSPRALQDIHRRLMNAKELQQEYTNSTILDFSWQDATLFEIATGTEIPGAGNASTEISGGVKIVCVTCYIKGEATARLSIDGDFNASSILDQVEQNVSDTISNITQWVEDIDVDFTEFEVDIPPPPGIDFNLELPEFPECTLEFQFDGVEMYVELSTVFSGGVTYTLPLFKYGAAVDIDEDLFLGIVFNVDLIISLESEVTITTGFHVRLEDGVLLRLAMFSKDPTDVTFNGGEFEFLPVEIETDGIIIRAILQLSLRAGFALEVDLLPGPDVELGPFNTADFVASAGLETRVYAHIADWTTNITTTVFEEDEDQDEDCLLTVQNSFQFVVGAAAGAYVGIGNRTWGPSPETEIPLFPTTFPDKCLIPTAPTAPAIAGRQDDEAADDSVETTTLEREVVHTAKSCGDAKAINCPASLETVMIHTITETLVTTVPPGSEATWPETTAATVSRTIDFGSDSHGITSSSEVPESEETGASANDVESVLEGETAGVSNKLIIGVSVGVGVPVLIGLIVGAIFLCKRKKGGKKGLAPYYDTTYESVVPKH